MMAADSLQSPQLKGESFDFEFTTDTDHRKRRRNRTTQSCLNCHTSKRKCDRKRPCQRCIQLGLTGLCVYEIDDPALRDDPSLDENTRLKNRIAELESLVRELRGKPHPRWADSSFRDGDPNEKWHSRATKCGPVTKRRGSSSERTNGRAVLPSLSSIKTEPVNDTSSHLYRFSASPAPPVRYHNNFQRSPPSSSYENDHPPYSPSNGNYHPSSGSPSAYHTPSHSSSVTSSYSDGGSYTLSSSDDGNSYHSGHGDQYSSSHPMCSCRTSPGSSIAYISLAHQLQSSLSSLRQYSPHPPNTSCIIYRRIVELNNIMHGQDSPDERASYDSGPSDREILTPLSASSGPASYHTGNSSGPVSPQEWGNITSTGGYNPYFPPQGEHGMYTTAVLS
ncbi:Heme-responsive zinc finger transcription factor HAP1 [Termitomyces sp. J132]|nr:Heme-responsive zinc finger transcription factor HAP1 [Termitomyces sp. J132]